MICIVLCCVLVDDGCVLSWLVDGYVMGSNGCVLSWMVMVDLTW